MLAKKGLMTAPAAVAQYVEDVFSTYLYTGNGSTQTITNGIDLSGEGGLVWYKARNQAYNHGLQDTARGTGVLLISNSTSGDVSVSNYITSFNSDGFTAGDGGNINASSTNYASWTFRKAEKFFDVVTYTGTGVNGRTVAHNLGSVPGVIIVKQVSAAGEPWRVYHRSLGASARLELNTTDAATTGNDEPWYNTSPTSTHFTVAYNSANKSGETYVAYLFAHDAGGFGDAGDQSVIKCGSFTHNGTSTAVNLGWEPQWLLIKRTDSTGYWELYDNMRGFGVGSTLYYLYPNANFAETSNGRGGVTATGVTWDSGLSSGDYIYIAIRRGPMKTPEAGTSVFTPVVRTGTNGTTSYTGLSFSPDLVIGKARANTYSPAPTYTTKLTGTNAQLGSSSTNGESTASDAITGWLNTGYNLGADNSLGNYNLSTTSNNYVTWNFSRAPGFFDVVCYTGTGSARTVSHNLGVAPELMIVKRRSSVANWPVYAAANGNTKYQYLNTTAAADTFAYWNDTSPTSSVFSVGTDNDVNGSGSTYVAYLFASVTGVSKVGSYTGTGTTLQINCGFTSGARFVMIKRTDDAYPWYVWDSARGIVSGNDPYIRINQTSAEVTDQDDIDPYSSGFELSSAALGINASGGTYIYLAIA